jgi:hypothetical protein
MTTSKQVNTTSVLAVDIKISKENIQVDLSDGREVYVPVKLFPRLHNATPEQRNNWRLIAHGEGIHWEEIDEDIAVVTLLRLQKTSRWPTANHEIKAKRQSAALQHESKAMTTKAKTIPVTLYRSSVTGKFVSSNYAKKYPKTTFKQTVRAPIAKKKK